MTQDDQQRHPVNLFVRFVRFGFWVLVWAVLSQAAWLAVWVLFFSRWFGVRLSYLSPYTPKAVES